MRNELTIFYHSENADSVKQIREDLSAFNIDLTSISEREFGHNLLSAVESVDSPVVVLLSYNWLTSTACLYNSMPALKTLKDNDRLLVVMADGKKDVDGVKKVVPTQIDQVKDAIRYMKYWQEAFVEARENRLNSDTPENSEIENATKQISQKLGDIIIFLRLLNRPSLTYITRSDYQPVFDHFGLSAEKVENQVSPNMVAPIVNDDFLKDEPLHDLELQSEPDMELPNDTEVAFSAVIIKDDIVHEEEFEFDLSQEDTQEETTIKGVADSSLNEIIEDAIELFAKDEDDEGFRLFEEAISSNYEENATLRYYYAYYLAQRKSAYDEAIHQLDTILLHDPKNDNAYFLLAELAEIKGNYALAKNYYNQTIQSNPDYPNVNYRIGVILQDQFVGFELEAAEYFRKEIEKDEENVDAYYRLGSHYSELEAESEQAESYFLKVLELDEAHAFANYDLALIYHRNGDAFKAAYYYHEGCNNNPELKTEQNDLAFLSTTKPEEDAIELQEGAQELAQDKFEIETKTILITGATSGIGLATAQKFAQAGQCRLILTGRRRNRLDDIAQNIMEQYAVDVHTLQFDVRDYVSVKEAISSLDGIFGRVDVLINNAGLALGLGSIESGHLEDWETMIDTNIKGLLYVTKEVTPLMIAQQSGHIINVGSIAGREAYPNGNVYNATKAAVDILTKAIRLDLHQHNIRVGQVAPGHVETEFALNRFHGDEEKARIYQDFKPLAATDVANIIFFMVEQPSHVNIQDILVFPTQQASATVINRSGRD